MRGPEKSCGVGDDAGRSRPLPDGHRCAVELQTDGTQPSCSVKKTKSTFQLGVRDRANIVSVAPILIGYLIQITLCGRHF